MKLSAALVAKKEMVNKKNSLEARAKEAMGYKVHLESKESIDQLYSRADFDAMKKEADDLRNKIGELKKKISKANQIVPQKVGMCVQDMVIEIGGLKDELAFLVGLRGECREERYGREEGVAKRTLMAAAEIDSLIDSRQERINKLNADITYANSLIEIE